MTQEELAEHLDLTQESLSRMEKGVISPKFSRLQIIAEVLQCPVADLFRIQTENTYTRSVAIADLLKHISERRQEAVLAVVGEMVRAFRDDTL